MRRWAWATVAGLLAFGADGPDGAAAPRLRPRPGGGLHPDAAIRALTGDDPPSAVSALAPDYCRVPWLPVVPSGHSRPRADVFRNLGIDEARTRDRRAEPT